MKEKLNNKYIAWGFTGFCVLGALILFFFLIYRWNYIVDGFKFLLNVIAPILYGLAIAYLLNPSVNFFEKKLYDKLCRKIFKSHKERYKLSRILAISTSLLILVGVIVACFWILIPELIKSLSNFLSNSNTYLDNAKETLLSMFGENDSVKKLIDQNYPSIYEFFSKMAKENFLDNFVDNLSSSIFGTLKFLYNLIIGFIIAIYLLNDKEKFKAQIRKIMYTFLSEEKIEIIDENAKYTNKIFGDFFSAKVIDSLIIGVLCFIGMLIFDIPYAYIIAVLVGITNIIPYFGPFIGAIPSAVLILLVSPSKCLTFLIFILLLQQFDGNILGPKILGSKTGLSSFWVLCSLLIFGGFFGMLGMIIGVPIFSIIYSFVNNWLKKKLASKKLPVNSKDYENEKYIRKVSKNEC